MFTLTLGQRAWGTPIPMILDKEKQRSVSVDEASLPVVSEQRGQKVDNIELPDGYGFFETETLDTFFDSSW